jgi:hypothetical protein
MEQVIKNFLKANNIPVESGGDSKISYSKDHHSSR